MNQTKTKKRSQKFQDLTGRLFGRLTVIDFAETLNNKRRWNCVCECGKSRVVAGYSLSSGNTTSCGCRRTELTVARNMTHGRKNTSEYTIWNLMKTRCLRPSDKSFARYGGRGIKVCDRWSESFEAFFKDMGDRPSPDHQIDRIDNDGDYCPENCRWATRIEQARNKSNNVVLEHNGIKKCFAEWAETLGIRPEIIKDRLKLGWTVYEALTKPVRQKAMNSTIGE